MTREALFEFVYESVVAPKLIEIKMALIKTSLPMISGDSEKLLNEDWPDLLFASSILAQSTDAKHLEGALQVATGALLSDTPSDINDTAGVLLDKLDNSRALTLAVDRELIESGLEERLGPILRIESARRDILGSVLLEHSGTYLPANKFQRDLWRKASKDRTWLSASAPTAAGKTYIVGQFLADKILSGAVKRLLYLAPTRALVGEVEKDLRNRFRGSYNVQISSLPLANPFLKGQKEDEPVIYVLTQERIHLLVNELGDEANFDLLVVDEAQKISDNRRGVILQDAIDRVVRINPEIKSIFVSPSTSNPKVLLQDRPEKVGEEVLESTSVMVLQNLLAVRQHRGKKWNIDLIEGQDFKPIGSIDLKSKPENMTKRIAYVAAELGRAGGTLVYVNGAVEAEKVAQLIRDYIKDTEAAKDETSAQDLLRLSELVKKGVHPKYLLASIVRDGVAFHYGNMPALVRYEVERLFKEGKLKFLVCTSTLIEGVNLSCKNIIVRGPRKGRGNPMGPQDFWNLAGRAGRWGTEFQGNIICLDLHNADAWPYGIPERENYKIQTESDAALLKKDSFTAYVEKMSSGEEVSRDEFIEFESVSSSILTRYITQGPLEHSSLKNRYDDDYLKNLDGFLKKAASEISLPPELVERHAGLNPQGLQSLLGEFIKIEKDPINLIVLRPGDDEVFGRLVTILNRINKTMGGPFGTVRQSRMYAVVILRWLEGWTLPRIIEARVKYDQEQGKPRKIADVIRETLELVENIARFAAPRYLSAYEDVLYHYLKEIGKEELVENELNIGTALEFGVSTQTLVSLMSIGLSRMTAVAINEAVANSELDIDETLRWLEGNYDNLEAFGIASLMIEEVAIHIGRSTETEIEVITDE